MRSLPDCRFDEVESAFWISAGKERDRRTQNAIAAGADIVPQAFLQSHRTDQGVDSNLSDSHR